MLYRSKPAEIEAMQWHLNCPLQTQEGCAKIIVAWVNANGGEARYVSGDPAWTRNDGEVIAISGRIAVRTINGWANAAPGHYVVKGTATFEVYVEWKTTRTLVDFYPCDPETFEKRWEKAE